MNRGNRRIEQGSLVEALLTLARGYWDHQFVCLKAEINEIWTDGAFKREGVQFHRDRQQFFAMKSCRFPHNETTIAYSYIDHDQFPLNQFANLQRKSEF